MTALIDLVLVALAWCATFFAGRGVGLPAPGTCAIVVSLAVATWRLRIAGSGWSAVGFRLPASWWQTLGWAVFAYAATVLLVAFVVTPIAAALGWPATNLSRFATLRGDALVLAGYLAIAWTTAAVGEELLFRGFAQARFAESLGGTRAAMAVAVVAQAVLFAVCHAYLGVRGVVTAGVVGLVYGIVHAVNGRQLVPLVIAHGMTDTLSLVALYAGVRAG